MRRQDEARPSNSFSYTRQQSPLFSQKTELSLFVLSQSRLKRNGSAPDSSIWAFDSYLAKTYLFVLRYRSDAEDSWLENIDCLLQCCSILLPKARRGTPVLFWRRHPS